MVPAELIAGAFGLATPRGPLVPVQHTSFQTSRLTTDEGDYLVKRLWEGDDPHWWPKIERTVLTTVGDFALCHGDFEPRNVLIAADGPVLIDWESVAPGSASLEAGRAAAAFGKQDIEWMKRFLQAYQQAGGSIVVAPEDLMLHRVAAELSKITEQIRAVLGDQDGAIPGWIDLDKADDRIGVGLNRFSQLQQGMREIGPWSSL